MEYSDSAPRVVVLAARHTLACCALALVLLGGPVGTNSARAAPIFASTLDAYILRVARAWEPHVSPDGRALDPLNAADSGSNYGVILLADVMLREAARNHDPQLAETGERIIERTATLPHGSGPFNLLAVARLARDGIRGLFPPETWAHLSPIVAELAANPGPPHKTSCMVTKGCYTNWRLVAAAGDSALIASGANTNGQLGAEIRTDLALAAAHVGPPLSPSSLPGARELSDPGAEPPAYHLFSCALLALIAEDNPAAMTPAIRALAAQAGRYALELMAPDGQLSYAGRSLDQSWVQAAGADLGAREAASDPAHARMWRSFADRALAYLMRAYPLRPDGILPIVPGLLTDWSPAIMDRYAALDQYEGLTFWFLADALDHWPRASAPRAPLPVDHSHFLAGDLHSSGLVWGRSGPVWWAVSGHSIGRDPRAAQGLIALKMRTPSGWHDLLALRPLHTSVSPAWTLSLPGGKLATPIFTGLSGTSRRAILTGTYRSANRHRVGTARWEILVAGRRLRLAMYPSVPGTLRTNVWFVGRHIPFAARGGRIAEDTCTTTASGPACPFEMTWRRRHTAVVEFMR